MKHARIIVAALMLFTVMLNSLPNSVLDLFHQHHHTQHEPYTGGDLRFEEEHIHCFIPDLFFEAHEVPAEVHVKPVIAYTPIVLTPVKHYFSTHTLYGADRAPPFTTVV